MSTRASISDKLLYGQVVAMTWAQQQGERLRRAAKDQKGQTPTEYLMIVGLMAAVIVLVFVTFYWGQVRGAAQSWVKAVKEAIVGKGIK